MTYEIEKLNGRARSPVNTYILSAPGGTTAWLWIPACRSRSSRKGSQEGALRP